MSNTDSSYESSTDSFSETDSTNLSSSSDRSESSELDRYSASELGVMMDRLIKKRNISQKCTHKRTKCNFVFLCCEKKFKCRKCHDNFFENDKQNCHVANKFQIDDVVCDVCYKQQPIGNKCIECGTIFNKYYCSVCKIFGDSDDNFHCDKCGYCVVGKKEDFKHCNLCGCCINTFVAHKCIENRLHSACAICMDSLRNGENIYLMSCNHSMHENCYKEYIKTNYKCPECRKTIKDVSFN